ncbi:MAG: nuclear transport factor 2 family protein [Bacteroidota bacterium]
MPHANADLVDRFYAAFAQRDAAAMRACYHPEVRFRDEVFDLHGARAGAMWTMLCDAGADLVVTHRDVRADAASGSARWEARYTFSATGRAVHNIIEAAFTFEDGLIRTHTDRFDAWRWSRQALGAPGLLLGWTPWLQSKVRSEAARRLDRYIDTHPEALGETGASGPEAVGR